MNDELLKNFFLSNNYSSNTEKNYAVVLNQYSRYHNMSLQELLDEAEEDENKGTRWKYSKLKTRLLEYRQYLVREYAISTAKTKMKTIIKFYRFYEIEVPSLPKLNEKSVRKAPPVYYKDLPVIDPSVGFVLPVRIGDRVGPEDTLCELYARGEADAESAEQAIRAAIR